MFVPMNATQSINASFVSSVELRQSFDLEFPWGPFSLFWPKKTYYHAVYISGPTVHVEIRVKDPVEGVAIVKDTLDKIKACAK